MKITESKLKQIIKKVLKEALGTKHPFTSGSMGKSSRIPGYQRKPGYNQPTQGATPTAAPKKKTITVIDNGKSYEIDPATAPKELVDAIRMHGPKGVVQTRAWENYLNKNSVDNSILNFTPEQKDAIESYYRHIKYFNGYPGSPPEFLVSAVEDMIQNIINNDSRFSRNPMDPSQLRMLAQNLAYTSLMSPNLLRPPYSRGKNWANYHLGFLFKLDELYAKLAASLSKIANRNSN